MGVSASLNLGIEVGVAACKCMERLCCKRFHLALSIFVKAADVVTDWIAWSFYFQHGLGPLDRPSPQLEYIWLLLVLLGTVTGLGLFGVYLCEFRHRDVKYKRCLIGWEFTNGWIGIAITALALHIYRITHDCSPSDGSDALLTYTALLISVATSFFFNFISFVVALWLLCKTCHTHNNKESWCTFLANPSSYASVLSGCAVVLLALHVNRYAYGTTNTSVWYTEQPSSISRDSNIPESVALANLGDIKNAGDGGLYQNHVFLTLDGIRGNLYTFRYDSTERKVYYRHSSVFCNTTGNYTKCNCTEKSSENSHLFLGFRNEGDGTVNELYCPEASSKPLHDDDAPNNLPCLGSASYRVVTQGSYV